MAHGWPVVPLRHSIRRRWDRLWRGECDPDTLRSVPSWGLSVILHALLILILAIMIRWSQQGAAQTMIASTMVDTQLGEVTSLVDAKQAGDPFTTTNTPDPPSIGLEAEPQLKMVGTPELRSLNQFTPAFAGPSPLSDVKNATMVGMTFPEVGARVTAPFSGRQGLTRAKLVRREGGTAKSEKSVEDGIEWLVRHQRADGSWALNYHEQCQGNVCSFNPVMESNTAATGLALLPLLGSGYIHTVKSRHQESVRRGISWLVDHQQDDGNLFIGPPGMAWMYSHAIGTMALCEAYGLSQDPRLKQPAQVPSDSSSTRRTPPPVAGVIPPARRATRRSSVGRCSPSAAAMARDPDPQGYPQVVLAVSRPGRDRSFPHDLCLHARPGRGIARHDRRGPAEPAAPGLAPNFPPLVKCASQIAVDLDSSNQRNIYYWYYATQLLHNMKNKDWEKWNLKVREGLIGMQVKDGTCANGSWDPELPRGRCLGTEGRTPLYHFDVDPHARGLLPVSSDVSGLRRRPG